jgi:hypothetical protein
VNPDDLAGFRCARLLILLELLAGQDPEGTDAERLALYDFFAAHPLLLARDEHDPDRLHLRLAGFDDRAIAYASPGHRLATAQQRLPRDLTLLIGWGLVGVNAAGRIRYGVTRDGLDAARGLTAAYTSSYRTAARIVVRRLRPLSGRKLRETVRDAI